MTTDIHTSIHPAFGGQLARLVNPMIGLRGVRTHRAPSTGAWFVLLDENNGHTSVWSWHGEENARDGDGPGFGFAGTLTPSMAATIELPAATLPHGGDIHDRLRMVAELLAELLELTADGDAGAAFDVGADLLDRVRFVVEALHHGAGGRGEVHSTREQVRTREQAAALRGAAAAAYRLAGDIAERREEAPELRLLDLEAWLQNHARQLDGSRLKGYPDSDALEALRVGGAL